MYSMEQEKVPFVKIVDPNRKNVEDWMQELEDMMKDSVKSALNQCVADYWESLRKEWCLSHPGQCILNGSQVTWTVQVEDHIQRHALKDYFELQSTQLLDLVELVRQELTNMQKVTMNALIVIDVHAKDVVEKMIANDVKDVMAFEWISQLRYYLENEDCFVKCVQTNFPYGYEYLGNTLRLVITPLTDKCYMTLMGALKLNLGGAPAGPAGTGKTESTKDLAKALAKQCVVFNCSDSMDYIMIGKFFKGLASAGAWCCFDEFNRINIEVLSVIAQQLLQLFHEKSLGTSQMEFEGSLIKIQTTFNVYITMNPGYAGRTELPDNLKALFRPVAMMVPDYAMIGEIMLYSFGFTQGRALARKMVATFKLSSEQLSSQEHYDYGMRAVRSVINAAGLLKARFQSENEEIILLRALRDVNVPKFLKCDIPLFENIMDDLFPTIKMPEVDYGQLIPKIKETCVNMLLQPTEPFLQKVLQLYDTIQVRHGLMLVGPTGGGKTSNYVVLQKAMTELANQGYSKVLTHVLNPKSITMGQLYGQFNEMTHEWADGVLAWRVRECTRDQSTTKHWIMFDGPVDALWIESMNTVLDDNKKLCLNSGQILTLTNHMTMMFEVEDLLVASPATVSRCGMIYQEPEILGIEVLVESWLQGLPENIEKYGSIKIILQELFSQYLLKLLFYVRRNIKEPVKTSENYLTSNFLKLLTCHLSQFKETELKKIHPDEMANLNNNIKNIFFFCLIWSVGVTGDDESRKKFDSYFRELMQDEQIEIPEESVVHDYEFILSKGEFQLWDERNMAFSIDSKAQYHEIMIPTNDSTRNIHISKILLLNNFNVLCCGPTGTGKSVNVYTLLTQNLTENYLSLNLTFSAQTSANQTQDTIDSKIDRRRKGIFGPPIGKKFVISIDDLNMPKKEQYGAQPPIELLRQLIDHNGWYNRRELQFMKIEDVLLIQAMGEPGGGRTHITPRIVRHHNLINYTELNNQSVHKIFSTLTNFYFKSFDESVKERIDLIIDCLIDVYETVKRDLLPTPSKIHYTFNMRDIWRVIQGFTSGSTRYNGDVLGVVKLWYHENMRVFHDRLTTEQDRSYLKNLLHSNFTKFELISEQVLDQDRIIFADFLQGREVEPKFYQQIMDLDIFIQKMDAFQDDFNQDTTFVFGGKKVNMRLVMFLDACEHIARISRVIRQPNGNMLLLGIGGSGRQSLSRMATFLTNYKIFQIEVLKNYNLRAWRDDLKKVLMYAGVENKQITFLFVDTQIINEQMLEDISNVLNSGDVTGIYQEKDMEDISQVCKSECVKKSLPPTKNNIFSQYLIRVKKNIHVIMALSPLGNSFSTRLRMFPSLINNSTIDWFTEWPDQALLGVGKGQLQEDEDALQIGEIMDDYVEVFKTMHKSVEKISEKFLQELKRHNYVTPTSYLELVNIFKILLTQKKKQNIEAINRLKSGLDKLMMANKSVEEMHVILQAKQPELEKKNEETQIMMDQIKVEKQQADETQKVVSAEEKIAQKESSEAQALAQKAMNSVAIANKMIEETLKEVSKLEQKHIIEVKTFQQPPEAVKVVLGGVVLLCIDYIKNKGGEIKIERDDKGKKTENYYVTAKQYLLNNAQQLLDMLKSYDKNAITKQQIDKLQRVIINDPSFNIETVERSNDAVKYLYKWVKAMYDYYNVYTETAPLRELLEVKMKEVEQKNAELKEKKDQLQVITDKITSLESLFNSKVAEQEALSTEINICEQKLERASKLTEGLSDEKTRWGEEIINLEKKGGLIPAHSILAAGMIVYSGPFTSFYRNQLEKGWVAKLAEMNLPHSNGITMLKFLGVQIKIQAWNIYGLPKDDTSIENGIIIDNTRRWPLMIDPQNQANKFIKQMGRDHPETLEAIKSNEANLMKTMELCVQFGRWVLIENCPTDLDPALEPILQQQIVKSGSSLSINIGDKVLAYNEKFKLFLTTTSPNPHFQPETFVKVAIINFAITEKGLEDQMIGLIVALEDPNLEQKKQEIVKNNAADGKKLVGLEDQILQSLSQVTDIDQVLSDDSLINQLSSSKKFSIEIMQRVQESKKVEIKIDQGREAYRSLAHVSSNLFFCIVDLNNVDPMYQYSLQWFMTLFTMSVENSKPSKEIEERLENLRNYFTYSLYENICRSLFEVHKLMFSLMMCIKIQQLTGKVKKQEWGFFLTGPIKEYKVPANPTLWIDQIKWPSIYSQITALSELEAFEGLDLYFLDYSDNFKDLYESQTPHLDTLPGNLEQLNYLQKILFLRAFRPDKVIPALKKYISVELGEQFIVAPTFNLSKCYKDSSKTNPLIFILSAGSDPISDFMKFAEEMAMTKRIDSISLGQGQGPRAEHFIKENLARGGWVLLANCHLAQSWMSELERITEQELQDNVHKDFRLWLTSMPSKHFPVSVLQNGVKITMEPPKGLRQNLLRTYQNFTNEELEDCAKPTQYKKLLFGFSLFHAIIQDRRKFGAIGWNIPYEFTNEDLSVCKRQLKMLLDEYDSIPYKVINYLGAGINYGGRVTDDKDERLIKTILKVYINQESLRDNHKYSESGIYYSCPADDLDKYITYIKQLPIDPEPEAFGMHQNAQITNAENETTKLLATILSCQPSAGAGEGASRDEVILEKLDMIEKKIPDPFDYETIAGNYPTNYDESMNTVLTQELIRYNRMLVIVKESIVLLKKGLKGLVVLSEELEVVADQLYQNIVPDMWAAQAFLSQKPLSSWTIDLQDRIEFLQNWIDGGTPIVFWVSGFFFPQAFLTGTLQNFARKYQVAIDKIDYQYIVKEEKWTDIAEKPESGCFVYGMYLEGARWEPVKKKLAQPKPKELFSDIPLMHFQPVVDKVKQIEHIYNCPLYRVVSRAGTLSTTGHSTNFVMYLEFDIKEKSEEVWIRSGVAAFLSLKY